MRLTEIDNSLSLFDQYKEHIKFAASRYKQNKGIYRGIVHESQGRNIFYIDPSKRSAPRVSANTHNYYTLWMDNSPAWQNFPKRSYSLICSTDMNIADMFGETYIIVPVVNTTIGVCPTHDLWDSFEKTGGANFSLSMLTDELHYIFTSQNIPLPATFDQLLTALKSINVDAIDLDGAYSHTAAKLIKDHSPIKVMDYILNPVANNFKLAKWQTFSFPSGREVWLSAPCICLQLEFFDNVINNKYPDYKL